MNRYDVIIIGAGAAGLMAAEIASRNQKKILLIEKMDQPGRKLRITGKGRCNITNISSVSDFLSHVGSNSRFLRNAFSVFFVKQLMEFFEEIGLPLKVERGNRVFPASDKAQDVFFALIKILEKAPNVSILKNKTVKEILVDNNNAVGVLTSNNEKYYGDNVILATGGCSYPLTGSTGDGYRLAGELGHTVTDIYPALVPLVCKEKIPPSLEGFTVKNTSLTVFEDDKKINELFGEMKFTEDGISGPITLTLSRYVTEGLHQGKEYQVRIDLKSSVKREILDKEIIQFLDRNGNIPFGEVVRKWLPEELIPLMLNYTGIIKLKKSNQITSFERRKLLDFLKDFPLTIVSTRGFEEAIITQGGVSLKEINPKTMESKLIKHLFFAGEVMDLDADTGGYNLQIAFSTGYVAGSIFD